jgi:hypothetical protein
MKLVRNVLVGRTWYGPAHGNADNVPADVAALVVNPRAWGERADAGVGGEAPLPEAPAPQTPDVEPLEVEVERPAGNASHGEWAAYAVARGVPADEAERLTRNELRDRFPGG